MVEAARLGVILRALQAERARKALIGADESDELAPVVAEALLKLAVRRYGPDATLSDILRDSDLTIGAGTDVRV